MDQQKRESNKKNLDSGRDFSGRDLTGADLAGRDLTGANFTNANLFKADLSGAILNGAKMDGADLTGANLTGAVMNNMSAVKAGMGMAILHGVKAFEARLDKATLTKATLKGGDFKCASMLGTRLREADLRGADFTEADMRGADLSMSMVEGARFSNADLRKARLRMVKGFEKAKWIGTDIREINFAGAYLMRRFIMDQNYLKEFRNQNLVSKIIYYIWLVSSDCGRSMSRWCLWIGLQTFFFAWLYTLVGVDYGPHHTMLSPLYFSVVTLTTLGYGDVVPTNTAGQLVAMLEVMTGYMMLGGLLSIFSNRMARRAE